jgi:cell division protease FtsH
MVCEWGMSEELGALTYGKKEEQIFLGREIGHNRDFSEDTARLIDVAVKKIIDNGMATVSTLLEEHKDILIRMSEELLEKETIVLTDIERIIEELRPGQYTAQIAKVKAGRKQAAAKKDKEGTPAGEEKTAPETAAVASPEDGTPEEPTLDKPEGPEEPKWQADK